MKYNFFTTSDGHLYAAPIKPTVPEWTQGQIRHAHRSIVAGVLFLRILVILLALFIAWRLFGE